ncbi:ribbon-helix-helix protein, CopG family [Anaerocaecibacter muris]|uniref:ribbon-helix-helix protein, CopG family n=1 Tax=Anaerocaecibacter muris TaxID=2941513 RepID=UPI00203EF171|nr:ribbon-helix-helix protein, CopG family [Anaerocaecibacter muris]
MGKGSTLSKEKRFTLCVPKDTFDKLSERAKQEQTSVSAIVRKLIIDGLAKA